MKRSRKAWMFVAVPTVAGLVMAGCAKGAKSAPLGDRAITAVDVAARAGVFQHPLDAAPSPDGNDTYFTGTNAAGAAVLRVTGVGGAVSTVAAGAPLAKPTGVAVATNGQSIYVADPQAGTGGGIFGLAATGTDETPALVAGTDGRAPRGLDVVRQGGTDVVYFTGTDPSNAEVGLF